MLAAQGFKGGSRGNTEWSQWVQSEKEQLAAVMGRYDIEWEHKGTHEKHLSVLDYKKQERSKEVEKLDAAIEKKQTEYQVLSDRIGSFDKGIRDLQRLETMLDTAEEYQLAEPLVKKLKSLVKSALARCFDAMDNYYRLNITNGNLHRTNERLTRANEKLKDKNETLRAENKDYKLLRKVFGRKQMDNLLEQARETEQSKKRERFRKNQYER